MSGDFLSRWSRRKLDTRAPPESTPEPQPDPAPAEPDLTPEEIAALPKPDELTPETDLTVFFRKGVPELLRNAALRRMWSLDPAIRDHVGDARDYAYDWNVPGGVPGNGPLLPTDDVDAMVREVFGERDADSDVPQRQDAPPGVETSSHDRDDAPRPDENAARPGAVEEGARPRDPEPAPAAAAREEGPKGQAAPELPAAARGGAAQPPGVAGAPPVRRHGRARPV